MTTVSPPPPPPRPGTPLDRVDGLVVGDVVMVAKQITSKTAPFDTYWWRTFRVVLPHPWRTGPLRGTSLHSVIAKLHVDPEKDIRTEELGPTFIVTRLEPHQWPQGVAAMHMKLLHIGTVPVSDDDVPF